MRRFAIALAAVVALVPIAARGDDRADRARAAELKKRGDDAMDSGRPADALTAYVEAYSLSKDPALLYNKGRALQALTEYPQALEELEAFDRTAPAELKERVRGLPRIIAEVRAKVTKLTVSCAIEGARVRLRDRTVGTCPITAPLVVNAGRGTLEVTREGYFPWTREVDLPGGGVATFDVVLSSKATTAIVVVKSSPPKAQVAIDGSVVGAAPVETILVPGTHTVELSSDGYRPTKTSIVLAAGDRRDVDVKLDEQPGILSRWWFWAGVGAVVAGGVVLTYALTTERDPREGTVPPGVVGAGLGIGGFRF